jgi:hypothetical protein
MGGAYVHMEGNRVPKEAGGRLQEMSQGRTSLWGILVLTIS